MNKKIEQKPERPVRAKGTKNGVGYMNQPHEMAKQPNAEAIFREIAAWRSEPIEQEQVFRALWSFWNFAHVFDDLIDGDFLATDAKNAKAKKEMAWKALAEFVSNLLTNPFLFTNAVSVDTILTSAIARQLDGDLLEERGESSDLQRAVRCADIDVVLHFARMAGGWECMRAVAPLCRWYDKAEDPSTNLQAPSRIVALAEWFEREDNMTERKAANV